MTDTSTQAALDISRHPLLKQIYDVMQAIEKCGASAELTEAISLAGDALRSANDLVQLCIDKDESSNEDCALYLRENQAAHDRIRALVAERDAAVAQWRIAEAMHDNAVKFLSDVLSALPPPDVETPDGKVYRFNPPPEHAMLMLRAFQNAVNAARAAQEKQI